MAINLVPLALRELPSRFVAANPEQALDLFTKAVEAKATLDDPVSQALNNRAERLAAQILLDDMVGQLAAMVSIGDEWDPEIDYAPPNWTAWLEQQGGMRAVLHRLIASHSDAHLAENYMAGWHEAHPVFALKYVPLSPEAQEYRLRQVAPQHWRLFTQTVVLQAGMDRLKGHFPEDLERATAIVAGQTRLLALIYKKLGSLKGGKYRLRNSEKMPAMRIWIHNIQTAAAAYAKSLRA